jgi:preprotein translocase subunit SecY
MSGVIPPIFASSLLLFPATIAGFFGQNNQDGFGDPAERARPSATASRCIW